MTARVAFFAGAFSPVHAGHVKSVQEVLDKKLAQRIIVVPASDAYAKAGLMCARDRLLLLELAFKDTPRVTLSTVDVHKPYFADPMETARELEATLAGRDERLVWLMGADRLDWIARNADLATITDRYPLIVVARPPYTEDSLLRLRVVRQHCRSIEFLPAVAERSSMAIQSSQLFSELPQIMGFAWQFTAEREASRGTDTSALHYPDWVNSIIPPGARYPDDESLMDAAIELGRASVRVGGGPSGAVIADASRRVVAVGYDRVVDDRHCKIHAEIDAIRNATTIIGSYRLCGPGLPSLQLVVPWTPCLRCVRAIRWCGIPRVVVGARHRLNRAVATVDGGALGTKVSSRSKASAVRRR